MSSSDAVRPAAPTGTQSIERALAVMWALAEDRELGIAALAQQTGLTAGTAGRIVRALAHAGLVRRNPTTDRYHLGAGLAVLGRAAERALGLDKAQPTLEALGERTQESINLVVRDGTESVVLMRVESTMALRFTQNVGARFPLYSTASGKAMLAFSPYGEEYLAGLPERLEPVAPGTIATRSLLADQLAEVRHQGYAVDLEENVEGVRCIGAPVLDDHGVARAAVVVQAPALRMSPERRERLVAEVTAAAAEISHVLPAHMTAPDH